MQLAQIFHEGLGIKRNSKEAVSLWLKAARRGHHGAQLLIGATCETGLYLKKDRVAAMRFFCASATQGNDGAESCLRSLERKLTPEERAQLEAGATAH